MASEIVLSGLTEYTAETFTDEEIGQQKEKSRTGDIINRVSLEAEQVVQQTETSVENNQIKEKTSEKSSEPRLTQLPLSRIKNLMKLDPDLQISSAEAVFLVAKATELFINSLSKEAYMHTAQAKKKTMQKRDVDMAVASVDSLMFLDGALNF